LAPFYPAKPGQVRQHQHMGVDFIYADLALENAAIKVVLARKL
jgi:hypothetical protein